MDPDDTLKLDTAPTIPAPPPSEPPVSFAIGYPIRGQRSAGALGAPSAGTAGPEGLTQEELLRNGVGMQLVTDDPPLAFTLDSDALDDE